MKKSSLGKLKKSRLSHDAAAELKRLIVQGVYPPGSRLPSEMVLSDELGVTRLTIREALAQLEAAGFTHTRHGVGTYVIDVEENATFQIITEMLACGREITSREAQNLLDFREVVVLGFTDKIAKNVTSALIEELKAIVRAEGETTELKKQVQLDYRFNEVLANASGNYFYALLMRSVKAPYLHLGEIVFKAVGDGKAIVNAHLAIVKALEAGDISELHKRMRVYIVGGNRIVSDWLKHQSG